MSLSAPLLLDTIGTYNGRKESERATSERGQSVRLLKFLLIWRPYGRQRTLAAGHFLPHLEPLQRLARSQTSRSLSFQLWSRNTTVSATAPGTRAKRAGAQFIQNCPNLATSGSDYKRRELKALAGARLGGRLLETKCKQKLGPRTQSPCEL